MSNVGKGNYYERRAKKELEKEGWLVEKAPKVLKWFSGRCVTAKHDYFGLWDLICVKNRVTKYVQVSVNRKPPEWFKEARAFPVKHKEFWRAIPNGAFKVEAIGVE